MPSATRNQPDCVPIGRAAFEAAAALTIVEIWNARLKHRALLS